MHIDNVRIVNMRIDNMHIDAHAKVHVHAHASVLVFHLQMHLGDLEEGESGSPPGLSSGAVAGIVCSVLVAAALVGELCSCSACPVCISATIPASSLYQCTSNIHSKEHLYTGTVSVSAQLISSLVE